MLHTLLLLAEAQAQAPAAGQTGQQSDSLLGMLPLLMGMAVLFYFLILRPESRKQRDQQAMLSSLKKGDKVLTIAGIYGTVVGVSDTEDEVVVKVDDNVRLKMLKGSISRNLSNEEAFKEAQASKGKSSQNVTTEPAAK